jgi:hypothetical protein
MTWLFVVVVAGCASIYPAIDLLAPGAVIRLQMRSTERRDSELGRKFQRWLRIDPGTEAWTDPGARGRVRYLGAGMLIVVWVVALALIAAAG